MIEGSRKEKERLLRFLIQKEERLNNTKLERFVANPGFQLNFRKSRARIRFCSAGNQSGKTTIGAVEHANYALGNHPFKKIRTPNVGIIVTAKSLKDGIQDEIVPKLYEVCGNRDIKNIKNNTQGMPATVHWRTGSISYMMSAEQDDVAFESKRFHHFWNDEPMRREIYIAQLRGMLTTEGHGWFTCTPLDEPWMYEEIYLPGMEGGDPNIAVFEGSSSENKRISEFARLEFFKALNEDEIETRWYGKFRHLTGRVFKEYEPRKNRIEKFLVPTHWPVWVSIDPHKNKPHAVCYLTVSPQRHKYVVDEIFEACTIYELAKLIKEKNKKYKVVNILIDTSAQEKGWGRITARQMLREKKVYTKLAKKKNLRTPGIEKINQLLKDEELFIFDTCIRTHRELTLQIFEKIKGDKQAVSDTPEKKFDDMTDDIRYILSDNPDYSGMARVKEYGQGVYRTA